MHRHGKGGFTLLLFQLMAVGTACTVWAGAEIDPRPEPAGVSSGWWPQAQAEIRRSEYRPSPVATANAPDQTQTLQAPNRAHNFRTTFTADGVRVAPRTASAPEWSWGLILTGLGAPGELRPTEPAQLRHEGNRVELVRGPVIEWYRNDERGLEQGFTLQEPPPGSAGTAELVLRLAVQGTLSGSLDPDGSALTFAAQDGRPMLRFDHLVAVDAVGRHLPARFGLDDGHLDIIVATAGAQYPLLIDPLATSPNWTAESNQVGAWLGCSVASAGDVNGDGYDDVIVGASGYDNGQADEGRAFVFHGSVAGLSPTPDWSAESDNAGARFGLSVATAGDVNGDGYDDVVIGAPFYENGQEAEGAIAIYYGSASGLDQVSVQVRESNQIHARYGFSVSTAGDVNHDGFADVIIGAPNYDLGQNNEGVAAVYLGSLAGVKTVPDWIAESNQADANFGTSVSTAGDVNHDGFADVIVGAPNYDLGQNNEGVVAVFLGSAFGLSATPNWMFESNQEYASMGCTVSTAGDVNHDGFADVIIGADHYDYGQADEGRAIVFHGSTTGLSATPNWVFESNQEYALLGGSASTAGDVNHDGFADVIVGAPNYDNGQSNEGRVFIFHGSSTGLSATPNWTAESDRNEANFGRSVAQAGDVNGDGFTDIIVGAPDFTNDQAEEGGAFVYHGSGGSFFIIPTPANKAAVIYLE